jgi:hypothetical protein
MFLWQVSRPGKNRPVQVTLINEAFTCEELAELIQGSVPPDIRSRSNRQVDIDRREISVPP